MNRDSRLRLDADVADSMGGADSESVPTFRLSGFYFLFFCQAGVMLPYWSLYLSDRGLSPLALSQIVALMAATKIVAPYLWGALADRRPYRLPVVRIAAVAGLVAFAFVPFVSSFALLALCVSAYAFFWNGTRTYAATMIR